MIRARWQEDALKSVERARADLEVVRLNLEEALGALAKANAAVVEPVDV